jgi:hypothetical protein
MTEQKEVKRMKRIRISWKIHGAEGHGLPFPPEKRKKLEGLCNYYNDSWGEGTHWIEEFEA